MTAIFSSEGNVVIDEGKITNYTEDYHYMELAVINNTDANYDNYTVFDHPLLFPKNILTHETFEFEIEILSYLKNCEPVRRNSPGEVYYKGMLKNFMLNN